MKTKQLISSIAFILIAVAILPVVISITCNNGQWTCEDSDGGVDPLIPGGVTDRDFELTPHKHPDECYTVWTVWETSCNTENCLASYSTPSCPETAMFCYPPEDPDSGAYCKKRVCTDTDPADDVGVKGEVTYTKVDDQHRQGTLVTLPDNCAGNRLTQWHCNPDDPLPSKLVEPQNTMCPLNTLCDNGACKKTCTDPSQCDSGQECVKGLCETPKPCDTNDLGKYRCNPSSPDCKTVSRCLTDGKSPPKWVEVPNNPQLKNEGLTAPSLPLSGTAQAKSSTYELLDGAIQDLENFNSYPGARIEKTFDDIRAGIKIDHVFVDPALKQLSKIPQMGATVGAYVLLSPTIAAESGLKFGKQAYKKIDYLLFGGPELTLADTKESAEAVTNLAATVLPAGSAMRTARTAENAVLKYDLKIAKLAERQSFNIYFKEPVLPKNCPINPLNKEELAKQLRIQEDIAAQVARSEAQTIDFYRTLINRPTPTEPGLLTKWNSKRIAEIDAEYAKLAAKAGVRPIEEYIKDLKAFTGAGKTGGSIPTSLTPPVIPTRPASAVLSPQVQAFLDKRLRRTMSAMWQDAVTSPTGSAPVFNRLGMPVGRNIPEETLKDAVFSQMSKSQWK